MEIKIFHVLRKNGEKLFIDSAEIVEGDTVLHVQTVNPSISNENEQEFKKGLVSCLNKFFPSMEITKREADNPEHKRICELLNLDIGELETSVRLYNGLKINKINSLKEAIIFYNDINNQNSYRKGLLNLRNFGKKSLEELKGILEENGLSLDMDLTPYQ